jgi:hypothetical protein
MGRDEPGPGKSPWFQIPGQRSSGCHNSPQLIAKAPQLRHGIASKAAFNEVTDLQGEAP